MKNNPSHFLIAAAGSGSGKTILTLGLLRALHDRGLSVSPFKCGPDYIDTKYHELASGEKAVNLDLFLSSMEHVRQLYAKYGAGKDVCVTEGVMGLFDGYDRMEGSSAQMAEWLDMPVILVVNAKSTAYSVVALLYGFSRFYDKIKIAGVIFNFVSSESHYRFLKEACEDVGLTALGYLPKEASLEIPSRHLGLTLDSGFSYENLIRSAASLVEKHIDIDQLLEITRFAGLSYTVASRVDSQKSLRIAVARDDAFNFMYTENLAVLEEMGEVFYFSPLADKQLPIADCIYFPGGYPEMFLPELSANESMKESIREYIENGGKIWAECGGMMYLSESITDADGKIYPMVGIFPQQATLQGMKLSLGYRRFEYNGIPICGHEFHYSQAECPSESITQQYNAKGAAVATKLLRYKNALAGYTHIYWGETKCFLDLFN